MTLARQWNGIQVMNLQVCLRSHVEPFVIQFAICVRFVLEVMTAGSHSELVCV